MAISRQDLINLLIEVRPNLSDDKAVQYTEMYPYWKKGIAVKVGERYQLVITKSFWQHLQQ